MRRDDPGARVLQFSGLGLEMRVRKPAAAKRAGVGMGRGDPRPGQPAPSRNHLARPTLSVAQPPSGACLASLAGGRGGHSADLTGALLTGLRRPENVVPRPFCPCVSASAPTTQFFKL